MIGVLIVIAVLLLIWFFPIGINAAYDEEGTKAFWLIGPVKLQLHPRKKSEKNQIANEQQKKQTAKGGKKAGGSYSDFLPILRMVVEFLKEFRKKLCVKYLEMKIVMAGDDPCDLAIHYGEAWAAVANLYPLLEQYFVIKKRNVEVECDFTAEKTLIFLRLDLRITFGRALSLGVTHGIRILKEYFRLIKLRKGGTK